MRKDKEKAIELRRAGKSYKQIKSELGIATSTLTGWFKSEPWSQEIKHRLSREVSLSNAVALELMVQTNRERWKVKYAEYRNSAIRDFRKLKYDPLFMAGIMLYWGEGEKQQKSSQVRLSNSDPEMIKVFYLFLSKSLQINTDRISAWLILYPDLVDTVQKNFWSRTTGIPLSSFKKSIYIKGRKPNRRISYGVCTVVVNSRALKERTLKWLELCQNNLHSHVIKLENED